MSILFMASITFLEVVITSRTITFSPTRIRAISLFAQIDPYVRNLMIHMIALLPDFKIL